MTVRNSLAHGDRVAPLIAQESQTAVKGLIVSHTGRRDSYELAYALSCSDRPVHLVTDFYYEPTTLKGKLARGLFGSGVFKRYRADLKVTVHSSLLLFITDIAERAFPRRKWVNMLRGWALGRQVLRVARQHSIRDIYAYYNSGAQQISRHLPDASITVFQMHPHPDALVQIYERYLARRPELRALLASQEEEFTSAKRYYDRLAGEACLADHVLCTSSFTRDTLVAAGVPAERIAMVPYGTRAVAAQALSISDNTRPTTKGVRLAFVGQFVLRKGIYELLSVAHARPDVSLEIFSREAGEAKRLSEGWFGPLPPNIKFRRIIDDHKLWARASSADFLVLPSLAEGFGLVISESMTHGLPVIATHQTAAPDLLEDGVSGFLMDGPFEEDLSQTIDRAIFARASWPSMRVAAREAIGGRTWPAFREGVLALLEIDNNDP